MAEQTAHEAKYPDSEWLQAGVNGEADVDFDDLDVFVNLLSSGNAALWVAYTWDAENRLVGVEPAGTPKSGDVKVGFVYDYMGGRVQKKVWTHNGSSWGDPTEHRKFVWNGWLLLMELDGLNDDAVLRKRTWGLDLAGLTGGGSSAGLASSRSMLEGAGGIGGLLAVYDTNGTTTGENPEADDMACVYFYDANGNVGQVCDLSHTPSDPAGAIVARYEYDPYGNVTSQSGTYAAANPFRFSTKYWDDETGLGYWGYRYYDPKLGRWVNRDSIDEAQDWHRYRFALARPTDRVDGIGRDVEDTRGWEPDPNDPPGTKDRCCVYIWLPQANTEVGHAAMSCNTVYMSFWPAGAADLKYDGPSTTHTFAQDLAAEMRRPDRVVCLDCLDEAAVVSRWQAIVAAIAAGALNFCTIGGNCSTRVNELLWAGWLATNEPDPECPPADFEIGYSVANLCWPWGGEELPGLDKPSAVERLARRLKTLDCMCKTCTAHLKHVRP